jgi:ABC-type dipeptide/oligopeptide/nickel transport system permease component
MKPRAIYWSVRRELWENRSIYIAPLAVAAVMVFGFFIAAIAALVKLDSQPDKLAQPFNFAALLMMSSPGLWIGLLVTAAFLAIAVRLRRYSAPI